MVTFVHPPPAPACRHCARRKVVRPRGLCFPCFDAPGVRDLYPVSSSKFNRRGAGLAGPSGPPPAPTPHPPGSPGKVAVLAERAAAGQPLHHPLDA